MAKAKKGAANDFPWSMVITAIVTFSIGLALMLYFGKDYLPSPSPTHTSSIKPDKPTPITPASRSIRLYFSNSEGRALAAEVRKIRLQNTRSAVAKDIEEVLSELLSGPDDSKNFFSLMPEGTRLLSVKFRNNTATINLSGDFIDNHPGGTSWEIQSIYSLVNTVALNFEDVKAVQLLFDGKKRDTAAGHISTKTPILPSLKAIGS
jgi:spore germination protein GerM